jgi:hypothetical protein
MFKGNKSEAELRFELLIWGIILMTAAVIYVTLSNVLPALILFIPGLILLGATIFQDMQPDWTAGWFAYLLSIIVVATGLVGVINTLLGDVVSMPKGMWLVIAIVELGAVFVAKALYDPNPR